MPTIQRFAICSIGSASAARSISTGSVMSCFCSFESDSGDQNLVFSSAASSVSSYDSLISIMRSRSSNSRAAAPAPSFTAGMSSSV